MGLTPGGNHGAELVLFVFLDFVLYFKLGSLERRVIRNSSEAEVLPKSNTLLFLTTCATSERRHDAFGWRSKTDLELQPKDARTLNDVADEQPRLRAPEKRCLFALGHVLEAGTKARGTLPMRCPID